MFTLAPNVKVSFNLKLLVFPRFLTSLFPSTLSITIVNFPLLSPQLSESLSCRVLSFFPPFFLFPLGPSLQSRSHNLCLCRLEALFPGFSIFFLGLLELVFAHIFLLDYSYISNWRGTDLSMRHPEINETQSVSQRHSQPWDRGRSVGR